jgi:ubiquinone/menaquinone biosynthesis C-methylase UbiE
VTEADFRTRSYDVWQRMAEGWESHRVWMWEGSRAAGEWLVEALDPKPGDTVLELAAGTGETGFLAAGRVGDDGKLISTDFAPNMVEAARAESERLRLTNVEHRTLDAEHMDLPDSCVDGVLCRWGYMLIADPAAAFRETKRVLREDGAVAFSVFAAPGDNPWAAIPDRLLVEMGGAPAPAPTAPGICALADPDRTHSLLATAGFQVRRMEDVPISWRFEELDDYWRFLMDIAGAISVRIAALTDDQRETLRARLEEAVEPYRGESGIELPGLTRNTLAG